ncbi:MAG: fluoride efflux transporter FluC [Acidimicrobiales bacterium]
MRRLFGMLGVGDPLPIDPDLAPDDTGSPSLTHVAHAPHLRRARSGVLLAIAAGGFLGTLARYEVELAWPTAAGHFPMATFAINTSGAFVLGLFLAAAVERRQPGPHLRPFVATGLLGGWTTYSTLAVEAVALSRGGHSPGAVAYLALSLVAGLTAATAGIALGRVHQTVSAAEVAVQTEDDGGDSR